MNGKVVSTLKAVMIGIVIVAVAVAFVVVFHKGGRTLAIVLSPLISVILAFMLTHVHMKRKYHLADDTEPFTVVDGKEYVPYDEILRRKHYSDRVRIVLFFAIMVVMLAAIALLDKI